MNVTVVTPTIPGREALLAECRAAVAVLGVPHLVGLDDRREGPAAVRNRLTAQAETSWVAFCDDDDLLYPDWLGLVTPLMGEGDVVFTGWDLEGADEPTFDHDNAQRLQVPVTACVNTAAFRAVGGFDRFARFEDHDLWSRLARAGYRFVYTAQPGWLYRRTAGSRSEEPL